MYGFVLCQRNAFVQVYILNSIEQAYSVCQRFLKGFAAADQAHTSCSFIDNGGYNGFL